MSTAGFARIMDPARREHFVYRCYDADGKLLYVGCTMDPTRRWREHKVTFSWARQVARCRFAGPYNYETARRIEYAAVRTEDPLHNGQNPRIAAEKRAESDQFNAVFYAAMEHGESIDAAARQARIALDSQVPA